MRVLIIHTESKYFAGAQTMLGYFLEATAEADFEVTLAYVESERMSSIIPAHVERRPLPGNQNFSPLGFFSQWKTLKNIYREEPFQIVHGWTARDWELTAFTGWRLGCPSLGLLHDHPQASFISRKRSWLMKTVANHGLDRIVCVSKAVERECVKAGYRPTQMRVIHNGLSPTKHAVKKNKNTQFTLGFLGAFLERKGFSEFFQILQLLWDSGHHSWMARIAGEAQDESSAKLLEKIRTKYRNKDWWDRLEWMGWVNDSTEFLKSIDVLVVPSKEFDPLPTVVIEAGRAARPVLGARVGGMDELIDDGRTGWLFAMDNLSSATQLLGEVLEYPGRAVEAGLQAKEKAKTDLGVRRMIANYSSLYSSLPHDVKTPMEPLV